MQKSTYKTVKSSIYEFLNQIILDIPNNINITNEEYILNETKNHIIQKYNHIIKDITYTLKSKSDMTSNIIEVIYNFNVMCIDEIENIYTIHLKYKNKNRCAFKSLCTKSCFLCDQFEEEIN